MAPIRLQKRIRSCEEESFDRDYAVITLCSSRMKKSWRRSIKPDAARILAFLRIGQLRSCRIAHFPVSRQLKRPLLMVAAATAA